MPLTAQQIAEKSSEALGAHDAASQVLGLRVTHIAPGQANVTMQVTEQMLNGHGTVSYTHLTLPTIYSV